MVKCKEQYYGGRNYLSFWCIEKFFIFCFKKRSENGKVYIYLYKGRGAILTL